MPALVVPTIFTAVDRLSTTVKSMTRNIDSFAGKSHAGMSRLNSKVNSLIPGYNSLKGAIMGSVGAFAIAGGIMAGISFGGEALISYNKNIAYLHTILSDLTDNGLSKFDAQIKRTASSLRESAVDVAASYGQIAELNPELATSAASLDRVSRSAIMLSKATQGKLGLQESAASLVTIMTQFKLGADQADRVANTLAAGAKYGASPIQDSAEAYSKFASTARRANVTLEQSNALIQILAASGIKAEDAGNALNTVMLRLQTSGVGMKNGKFSIVDALKQVVAYSAKIKSESGKATFLKELFGQYRIAKAGELLDNISKFETLTTKLTGTTEAVKAAKINNETFAEGWRQLKNTAANYLITNDKAQSGLQKLKKIIGFVTDNFNAIINGAITFIKWFVIIKTLMWSLEKAFWIVGIAQGAYNVIMGTTTVASEAATTAIAAQTVVVRGFGASLAGVTTEIGLANTAGESLLATFGGLAALAAAGGYAIYSMFNDNEEKKIHQRYTDLESKIWSTKGAGKGGSPDVNMMLAWQKKYLANPANFSSGTQYEKAYSDFYQSQKMLQGVTKSMGQMPFNKTTAQRDGSDKSLLNRPVFVQDSVNRETLLNRLHIDVNDPGKVIKSTSSTGPMNIPVNITPTIGQK